MKNLLSFFTYLCLTALLIKRSNALSCPPCEKQSPCTVNLSTCAYGVTWDICACCKVCAKGPNEECGGIWNHKLNCGEGLKCIPSSINWQLPGRCKPTRGA